MENKKVLFFFMLLLCNLLSFPSNELKKIAPNIIFHKAEETLNKIKEAIAKNEKGAYLRLTQDEINLVNKKDSSQQKWSQQIEKELKQAFSLNGNTIIKTLPLHSRNLGTYDYGMWNKEINLTPQKCINTLKKAKQLWGNKITDVYSPFALHFYAITNPIELAIFLKFIKNKNCCLFVGSEKIPLNIIKLLFGDNCKVVSTPNTNVYQEMNRIERECLDKIPNNNKYKIIATSMGPSGKVLQKRLWKKLDNIFLIDFGSIIDLLCGWKTKSWIKQSKFNHEKFMKHFQKQAKIICTSALIKKSFHERKKDYIRALKKIEELGYQPYIIEACANRPSFLDKYSNNVFYAKTNNPKLKNKGVNEVKSMIAGFNHFKFHDDDMIIKLTGRYKLADSFFVKLVEYNIDADAIARYWVQEGSIFTGCFAMKYKHFKNIFQKLDLKKMEKKRINVESIFGNYLENLKKNGGKVIYLDFVHVLAYHFGPRGMFYKPNNKLIKYW